MNITIGVSVFIIYGTFILLYFLFNRRRGGRVYRTAHINSVVCYAVCFAALTLLPANGGQRGVNFVPLINFLKSGEDGRVFELTHFLGYILNATLNVLLFIPLGFFTAVYCGLNYARRPFLRAFLISAAVSAGVLFLRLLLPFERAVDIDFALYGALGALKGVFIFGLLRRKPFMRNYLKMLRLSADVDQVLS